MKGFWQIVLLELRAVARSRALALLLAASTAWMFAMPHLVKSDGTAEGAREMYVHYSLGGVFALLVVSLVAAAAGTVAKDREAKRLQLTLVRPVRYFAVAFGRFAALTATGAFVLAVASAILLLKSGPSVPCDHVLSPVMESPRQEALRMYEAFMNDPDTPKEARTAKKDDVVRILEQKAREHYQSIETNAFATWDFRLPDAPPQVSVRMRFSTMFDTREDVRGRFSLGPWTGSVSNITKSIVSVPLKSTAGVGAAASGGLRTLRFENDGENAVMLRPRRDVNLLVRADSFAANLLRAYLQLVSMLGLAIAFGVFLGSGLGRSSAVFTAMATLFVAVASPAVVEGCTDDLETSRGDRIGLRLTRLVEKATSPFSSLRPLEALSADECVEWPETSAALAGDLALLPILLALLSAAAIPLKQRG